MIAPLPILVLVVAVVVVELFILLGTLQFFELRIQVTYELNGLHCITVKRKHSLNFLRSSLTPLPFIFTILQYGADKPVIYCSFETGIRSVLF